MAITLPRPRIGRDRYQNNLGEFEIRIFLYEHVREQTAAVRAAGDPEERLAAVLAMAQGLREARHAAEPTAA